MDKLPQAEKPAPFLANIMCERKSKKENIPLGLKYWSRPEWKVFYKQQILGANRLLKIYPFEVICSAINNKKTNWVYSLYSPQLKQILEEEFAKYERHKVIEEKRREKEGTMPEYIQTEQAPTILGQGKSLKNLLD